MKKQKLTLNKRADGTGLLPGHAINIILAIICILSLFGLVALMYFSWKDGQVKRAEDVLTAIQQKISALQDPTYTKDYVEAIVHPPGEGWFLVNSPQSYFPEKQCSDDRYESCLCICKEIKCEDSSLSGAINFACASTSCQGIKACKGFKTKLFIESTHQTSNTKTDDSGRYTFTTNYPEALFLKESSVNLKISKQENLLKITQIE